MTDLTAEQQDWETLAAQLDPAPRPAWAWEQHARTIDYLLTHLYGGGAHDLTTVARRAAVILLATPDRPELEQYDGIRLDPRVEGQGVKCRNSACRRKWVAIPEDPYFDGTTRADGICMACVLLETRTDDAVPVLDAVVVSKPRRKAVTTGGAT